MNRSAVIFPLISVRRICPSGLIAEFRFTAKRCPVPPTTEVSSSGAQVVPEWSFDRTCSLSAK